MQAVLNGIDRIGECQRSHEVGRLVAGLLPNYGLDTYAIGGLPVRSDPSPARFICHNWPAEWSDAYDDLGFGEIDPIPKAAMIQPLPFTISALRNGDCGVPVGAECDQYFAKAAALGRKGGLVVPIHGPLGYHGISVFSGRKQAFGHAEVAALHILAIHAHARLLELVSHDPLPGQLRLTPREIETMRHSAQGLTDREISQRLGNSVRTVRFHFENARRKLSAKTRAEAIAVAVGNPLLAA